MAGSTDRSDRERDAKTLTLISRMPRGVKKENLPRHIINSWRKKWEKCLDEVASSSRSLFSFLGSQSKSQSDNNDAVVNQQKQRQHERLNKQHQQHVEDAQYRMSMQHSHPRGPWRAMSIAVQRHNDAWVLSNNQTKKDAAASRGGGGNVDKLAADDAIYRVLDLACGPRGEPGTTIAHLLPLVTVQCTDSCADYVALVPTVLGLEVPVLPLLSSVTTTTTYTRGYAKINWSNIVVGGMYGDDSIGSDISVAGKQDAHSIMGDANQTIHNVLPLLLPLVPPPPSNLTKLVLDMSNLTIYPSNSIDAITCCYGYAIAPDIAHALSEAHRVLVPGGILVIATWEKSAMLSIGRDVLATVRSGGTLNPNNSSSHNVDDLDAFLPPLISSPSVLAYSGPGVFEALLINAGFDNPGDVVVSGDTYPFDLGSTTNMMLTMGTILIKDELEDLGAFNNNVSTTMTGQDDLAAGGWKNLTEEAFWINIKKYTDMVGGTMLLRDNTFKITVSTKKQSS